MVGDFLSWLYPWPLALHIMSVIAWMAGIFYLPRLFVYHVEKAADRPDLAAIYQEMELKLYRVIMNPAMIATWIFGLMLVFTPGIVDWSDGWVWTKTVMVVGMTWFHHLLGRWRKELLTGASTRSGRFFRLWNEAPTLMMVVIVVMVIVRPF
ncbi:MAG: protoporphyrinogen oxidase HemJ [Pseudomonadota bacterium]